MAKRIDITDKLSFEENPRLCIRGQELEVHADAATVLKILDIIGDGEPTVQDSIKCVKLLLGDESRAKLEELNLPFSDYMLVIQQAMSLAVGSGEEEETGADPTMT